MKRELFAHIKGAEQDYKNTIHKSIIEAEKYVDERKRVQAADFEKLKYEWYLFEKSESEKFMHALSDDENRLEDEANDKKARLKACRDDKIEAVSERIKEEVRQLIWR